MLLHVLEKCCEHVAVMYYMLYFEYVYEEKAAFPFIIIDYVRDLGSKLYDFSYHETTITPISVREYPQNRDGYHSRPKRKIKKSSRVKKTFC